jgi:PEP-CTERM motif
MKMLRYLFAIVSFCVLAGVAKADQADFHMVVLDPPPFATYPIFSTPFSPIVFSDCSGQLPTNVLQSYDGCFTGVNRTGNDWIGLQLTFNNNSGTNGQPVGCTLDGGGADFYQTPNCTFTGSQYILTYASGTIFNNEFFVIAEEGVSPDAFPPGTLEAVTAVPEPGSLWLLSTGLSAAGAFFAKHRRAARS